MERWHAKHTAHIKEIYAATGLLPWWTMHPGRLVHWLVILWQLMELMQQGQTQHLWPSHQQLYAILGQLASTVRLPVDLRRAAIQRLFDKYAPL